MLQRRFFCDCRTVAIAVARLEEDFPADRMPPNVEIEVLDVPGTSDSNADTLDRLRPAIKSVLVSIYSICPAAARFPLYMAPPEESSGTEVAALVRAAWLEVMEMLDLPVSHAVPVLFLPAADCAGNAVLSLFESAPDLPGATILAFDSPLSRFASNHEADEAMDGEPFPPPTGGKPNEGAAAILVTNAHLPDMQKTIPASERSSQENDAMTPYWERAAEPGGYLSILAHMNSTQREQLTTLTPLARIHRANVVTLDSTRTGMLEMTRMFQGLLEMAQINCGLIDNAFTLEEASGENLPGRDARTSCKRLVHNAGNAGEAGKRLATLGSAMLYFGIDFSPVDRDVAANVVNCIGNIGSASGVTQLALCIAQAAGSSQPALSAEFMGPESVAMSIVMPASAESDCQRQAS